LTVPNVIACLFLVAVPAHTEPSRPPPCMVPCAAIATVPGVPVPDLRPVLGRSGNLRALIGLPAALNDDPSLQPLLSRISFTEPGVHALGLAGPDGDSLVIVSMAAFQEERLAYSSAYRTGRWPTTGLADRNPLYAPPAGFISVTSENQATAVSKHFRLQDFLTHDQQAVWPKVLVLRLLLVDKLELISAALAARGLPDRLHVMSGFRTPQYNALGVGAKGGRATGSRHMYGDAADVFVDADGDDRMDDLDGDGRVTVRDARLLLEVAEGVEWAHPELVGGLSAYPATSAHGPFVHVDTRGTRARW
jgi:hypothetical protein